ncbi:magnesium transporter [Silicimonas algicola]|uniref:Magnesium transporter MgtE n=1 Tax=Silicimonas algicola TaxID=1826607 RepID=A0A316G9J2_9RHOB|nr:magnesium transporter [Silicimonas algicola]AZQ67552.1 magnesium transporter [Silicimonas algicola]PWK57253.1 Mg2+ transporter MgtE [Silicimonas algicola]
MTDAPETEETPVAEEDRSVDEDYALDNRAVAQVLEAVAEGDKARLTALFEPMHAADIADLLEQVEPDERRQLVLLAGSLIDGEVLSEINEDIREEVIETLTSEQLADAMRELESDDVVDIIEDLDEDRQEAVLDALDMVDRIAVEQALSYPEYSAGRLMQREVVIAPEHWTVGDTIDHLRGQDDLPEQFYHVILVDPRHRPVSYVTLGRIMSSPRTTPLASITEESFRKFEVDEYEGDVAYAFNQYHLISAPVTDADGRLVGVITIDDAMAVLDEEHEEDVFRLAGVGDESLSNSTFEIVRRRFPWLGVNLLTAILASVVISLFEDVLSAVVALAVLMPIVASMGGNAGTQSMTVAVRALATRDLTGSNAWRVVRREAMAGLLNGCLFAVVMAFVGSIWFGEPLIGVVIAVAMVVNLLVAGLSGVLVPLTLERFGIDPALASGTFVTTVTDVVGFFAFLGLASLVLL